MKELSIEEKAKRYDEAIERAKEINREHSKNGFKPSDDVLYIFPEFKMSEDERIRKAIIKHFRQGTYYTSFYGFSKDEIIAWLEKRSEHKIIENADDEAEKYAETLYCSNLKSVNDIGNCSTCENVKIAFKAGLEKQGEQTAKTCKDAWSGEDVNFIEATIGLLNLVTPIDAASWGKSRLDCVDWLKSLRPQLKQKWTREDEINRDLIYNALNHVYDLEHNKSLCDWLNSLSPQNRWKPSLSQLNALGVVAKGNIPDDIEEINSLYNDLKKL